MIFQEVVSTGNAASVARDEGSEGPNHLLMAG